MCGPVSILYIPLKTCMRLISMTLLQILNNIATEKKNKREREPKNKTCLLNYKR